MKAELVPENGDRPIPILRDVTVVGRREFCDVQIDDPSLSKRHCVLVRTDGLLVVRDLATTNGTKVKGQRIRWAALLPDDRLTLGAYKVRVYLGPDDVPSPLERWVPNATRPAAGRPVAARATGASPAPARPAPPAVPVPSIAPAPASSPGFPAPSPLAVPALGPVAVNYVVVLDDDSDSDWRQYIGSRPNDRQDNDDLLIELD
ncbi:MAG: FHA domain-containing protein [Isosphaeraceae bacterium]